ncbi:hypothetical protein [Natrinema hispanicum]|uniref:Uncharacterized protein n=1 Tax=Natrinema hispanicum TaxID=392421 RepID=A0A1G6SLH3_9EURY|nr:hypothetical protein [Natrinema hispanicum]SDD17514.1 hypothetical protein SAMN05192552_101465 [Natrinema hispanicum]
MTSDKEVIEALMNGLDVHQPEPGVLESEVDIDQSAVAIEGEGDAQFNNFHIERNKSYNHIEIRFPIELQAEAFVRLEELLEDIEIRKKIKKKSNQNSSGSRNNCL